MSTLGKPDEYLTKKEIAERDREFKKIEKEEKERAIKRKKEIAVATAEGKARFRFELSEFGQLHGNTRELLITAKEFQVLKYWFKKNFKYNHNEALKLFEEDGKKLLASLYKEELAKVK